MLESCSLLSSISHLVGITPSFSVRFSRPFSLPLSRTIPHRSHCNSSGRNPSPPTIYAHSIGKPRARKKVKSNADLCSDIREFLSTVGLPEDHVPSTKELLQHGRQDLANIVRRRGYKLIKELLATSTTYTRTEFDKEEGLVTENKIKGQDKEEDIAQDVSREVPVVQNGSYVVNGANDNSSIDPDRVNLAVERASTSSVQEKVAKFIHNGELDAIEDDSEELIESLSQTEESTPPQTEMAKTLNSSTSSLKQKVLPAKDNPTRMEEYISRDRLSDGVGSEGLEVEMLGRMNEAEVNRLKLKLHQKELELSKLKEEIVKEKLALSDMQTKAEAEIRKAQNLLLETDSELRDVEESLSELEEVRIEYRGDGDQVEVVGSFNGWHHRITMDPDPDPSPMISDPSGAGVSMNSDLGPSSSISVSEGPASSISDPSRSRKPKRWKTDLWLYPGNYEIKFLVDGAWQIDPDRESITKGSIQNNILRVDRS